jgi:N-acetylglutamate synthase-like GNAT family acetyltransferase
MAAVTTAMIRPATSDDWPQIEALLVSAALPLDGAGEAFRIGFVAEAAPHIVGTVALELHGDTALLRSLAVAVAHRGEGIGRRLVESALTEARRRQLSSVHLLTTTAASFFPRCGFTTTTRAEVPEPLQQSVEFRSACPASAAVLVLELR